MITQTLDGRYVDKAKLVRLLKELFGEAQFQVKVLQNSKRKVIPVARENVAY